MADHAPAVRRRPPLRRGLTPQVLILALLIAVAFGTAPAHGGQDAAEGRRTATVRQASRARAVDPERTGAEPP
ncbi:hypothetical protein ACWCQV_19250, partial [Streptomyces eurythermus]